MNDKRPQIKLVVYIANGYIKTKSMHSPAFKYLKANVYIQGVAIYMHHCFVVTRMAATHIAKTKSSYILCKQVISVLCIYSW